MRDALALSQAWRLHGIARRRFDRERLAATARLFETRIIATANALLARAAHRSC